MPVINKKQNLKSPTKTVVQSFILVILVGTLLLMLPISSKDGNFSPLLNSLFTATSATCVTGLVVYDTLSKWTVFGQCVILLMIQIGGLGLVTFVTFINFALGRKLGLRRMQMASESVNADGFEGAKGLIKNIIRISLITETIGALILMIRFIPKYGVAGIFKSFFISISAFCNAGFDILGDTTPFASLTEFSSDPLTLITVMLLIIAGGVGFIVWHDLICYKKTKHLELHTKIVLIATGGLILIGTIGFLILEYNNTLSGMGFGDKVLNGAFQSVTCRTAGFNSIDTASLTSLSKILSILLMYIGAAPGSTGGGIKVTTAIVILMTVVSVLKNKEETIILKKRIEKMAVYKALTIVMLSLILVAAFSLGIYASLHESVGAGGIDVLFETVSAFATVGLSVGVTAVMNTFSGVLLIVLMFLGRVGPISVILFLAGRSTDNSTNKVVPEGKIMVG